MLQGGPRAARAGRGRRHRVRRHPRPAAHAGGRRRPGDRAAAAYRAGGHGAAIRTGPRRAAGPQARRRARRRPRPATRSAIRRCAAAGIDVISTAEVADVQPVAAAEVRAVTGAARRPERSRDDVLDEHRRDAVRGQLAGGAAQAARPRQHLPGRARCDGRAADGVPAGQARGAARDRASGWSRRRVPRPGADRQRGTGRTCWSRSGGRSRPRHWFSAASGWPAGAARAAACSGSSQQGPAPAALAEPAVEAAATAGGRVGDGCGTAATPVPRSSRRCRRLSARHLVLAVPSAGLLERWRGTLLERLAGQLPGVHLHIEAAPAAAADSGAWPGTRPSRGAGRAARPRRDPGLSRLRARLRHARPRCWRRRSGAESRGSDVVVGAVDARDREEVTAELEDLELIGDGSHARYRGGARAPPRGGVHRRADARGRPRRAPVRRGQAAGRCRHHRRRHRPAAAGSAPRPAAARPRSWTSRRLLALADEIELVDVPPSILIDRVRRGEIVPPDQVEPALATTYDAERAAQPNGSGHSAWSPSTASDGWPPTQATTRCTGRARPSSALAVDPGLRGAVARDGAADQALCGAGGAGLDGHLPGRRGAVVSAGHRGGPAAGRVRGADRAARRRVRRAGGHVVSGRRWPTMHARQRR